MICGLNSTCCAIDKEFPILVYNGNNKDNVSDDDDKYHSIYSIGKRRYYKGDESFVKIVEKKESVKSKINDFFEKYLPDIKPFKFYLTGATWCSCT